MEENKKSPEDTKKKQHSQRRMKNQFNEFDSSLSTALPVLWHFWISKSVCVLYRSFTALYFD